MSSTSLETIYPGMSKPLGKLTAEEFVTVIKQLPELRKHQIELHEIVAMTQPVVNMSVAKVPATGVEAGL